MALVTRTFSDIITFTRASTGTFFNSSGVLTSAAINAPRFDYNPSTLAAQGLLIEEARTNLCLQSEDFATTWTVSGTASITTNQLTSPAGTLTADLLTTTAGGPNRVLQAGVATVSTTYAASMFVKTGNINGLTFRLFFSGGVTVDTYADFTFSSATFSGINGAGVFSAQNCGNGWYKITCVIASGNNNAWEMRIGGLVSTAQTGTTAYLWGAQLEAGAFPTSYIPTTTTALTRSADVAAVNTLSPWFNSTAGTLYAEYIVNNVAQNNSATSLSDGTNDNRMLIRASNASAQTVFIGVAATVTQWNDVIVSALANTQTKSAFAYATNDIAWVRNAGAVGSDTLATIPTVNRLQLGLDGAATFPLNGYLRRITYYPRRLSNAELQTITA